jgi:hypothetical protein
MMVFSLGVWGQRTNVYFLTCNGYNGMAPKLSDCPTGKGMCATDLSNFYVNKELNDVKKYFNENKLDVIFKINIIKNNSLELEFIEMSKKYKKFYNSENSNIFSIGKEDIYLKEINTILKKGTYIIKNNKVIINIK